jgi:acyl dehydratase
VEPDASRSWTFPVEAGHIMLFARAIGDPNPIYSDPEYAAGTELGGIIAPPTFVAAGAHWDPGWRYRPEIGEPWFGSGVAPSGVTAEDRPPAGGVHAEQHFEFHRPLRPGDVLTATIGPGNEWVKQRSNGGELLFSETITTYTDADGDVVAAARMVKAVPR